MMAWQTHEIHNQFEERVDYNLYATDVPLQEALRHHHPVPAGDDAVLHEQGARLGSASAFALAEQANRHPPELHSFNPRGRRIDQVEFHPAWHTWQGHARAYGLHSLPFLDTHRHQWSQWAARFYLHAQVEAGSLCPTAMTLGSIPLLQREPALWDQLGEKLLTCADDPHDRPIAAKQALWIGMGMTEKQGGSDVRSNQTQATPVSTGGRGGEYLLRGHKWFFSAPMCDAHLVVAQTPEDGLACFFVPRWRPDGSKNTVQVQRLKHKVGNQSNSSSEVEFHDAWGLLIGEPGRGIPTIIEMATCTRLTCAVSSAGFIRQALVQSLAYTRQRRAFGRVLAEQPLMQGVLADMALESEAALALAMRLARAYESDEPSHSLWRRIMTPAAKFWVCKRAVELTGEAMEVFGGNGYVDTGIMARLFKEAPVNSIWEGSGNVMCLDVIRAITREPQAAVALLDSMAEAGHADAPLRAEADALRTLLARPAHLEACGRSFTARLARLAQACLLREQAPTFVADGFIATRYSPDWGHVTGMVDPSAVDIPRLLARAFPV